MTEPTVANINSDPARLDELAEVTRDYAKYSRTAYGLAPFGWGIAALTMVSLDIAVRWPWARLGYVLLAPVWVLLLAGTRRYYQRHGTVVEPRQRIARRGWILGFVYVMSAGSLFVLAANGFFESVRASRSLAGLIAGIVVVFGLVAVPVLAAEVVRGKTDAAITGALVALTSNSRLWLPTAAGEDPLDSVFRVFCVVTVSLCAILGVIWGTWEHRRYRALDRRFAALRKES